MRDGLRYCQNSNGLKFILTYTVATFFENNFFFFFKGALLKKGKYTVICITWSIRKIFKNNQFKYFYMLNTIIFASVEVKIKCKKIFFVHCQKYLKLTKKLICLYFENGLRYSKNFNRFELVRVWAFISKNFKTI